MKKNLVIPIPQVIKPILKRIYYFPVDTFERIKGRDSMIPPKSLIFVGQGDFLQTGNEFKNYFITLGQLRPSDRVLDVGCGIGRMAVPLTNYLSAEGSYWGMDISSQGIEWCKNRISPKFKNFHFLHSDIYNKHYNKKGKKSAQNFKFPFTDNHFHFIFLTSVFTHMLPLDLENYISQIARVLKPGGKCLITFFLLNQETEKLIRANKSTLNFRYKIFDCLTINKKDPEAAIAYREEFVKKQFEKNRLKIIPPIHYGSWCNRNSFLSYQDIILVEKQ